MENKFDLPEPSAEARDHSHSLTALIRERIDDSGGWIDFAEYMSLALYAPGLGYYSAGSQKFGPAGDFVTAPEISPLFSRCLARSVGDVLQALDGGVVMEIGAGTGAMAAEILRVLDRADRLPESYLILEVSADLRERQYQEIEQRVPHQLDRVVWLETLPEPGIDGVILANEVMDALPVNCFCTNGDEVLVLGVSYASENLCWKQVPASGELLQAVLEIREDIGGDFPDAYRSEICPVLPAWISSIASALNRGLIMLVDYGLPRRHLYHPDRAEGSLICHYRHRAHNDPFFYPGLQDISAWVDFTAVARSAGRNGLTVAGYTTQAHYLLDAGVEEELTESLDDDPERQLRTAAQLKTLMLPGEMGERFKVMGLSRQFEDIGAGFGGRDLRHTL